jgi:hypothetical protein
MEARDNVSDLVLVRYSIDYIEWSDVHIERRPLRLLCGVKCSTLGCYLLQIHPGRFGNVAGGLAVPAPSTVPGLLEVAG